MAELADLFPAAAEVSRSADLRPAVVLSVAGRVATVDMGGPITVSCLDSCVPVVGQTVLVGAVGSSRWAVGVVNGTYRQSFLKVTANATTTVTGILNGVSTAVSKVGAFTAGVGDNLLLIWAGDGSVPYVVAPPGVPYIPPSGGGGGGGTPPPSGGGTYTTSYAATTSYWFSGFSPTFGDLDLSRATSAAFDYGVGRMRELASKTLISGRIYLPRVSGSGNVTLKVGVGPGSSSTATGGWASLPTTRLNELVAKTSLVSVFLSGSGVLKGIPAGTIQITWS